MTDLEKTKKCFEELGLNCEVVEMRRGELCLWFWNDELIDKDKRVFFFFNKETGKVKSIDSLNL